MTPARISELENPHTPAHLVTPGDQSNETLVLFLHWFDEAPNANRDQFLDEASELADHGFTSLLPQLRFPWMDHPSSAEHDIAAIHSETDTLESIYLQAKTETGTSRIAIVGHDFGAMHGMLLARRIDPVCLISVAATPRWADWFLTFWPIDGDRYEYIRDLGPLDPISCASAMTMPTFYQFAANDFYIAPMNGLELFRATPEPSRLETYPTDHSMSDPACRVDRIEYLINAAV